MARAAACLLSPHAQAQPAQPIPPIAISGASGNAVMRFAVKTRIAADHLKVPGEEARAQLRATGFPGKFNAETGKPGILSKRDVKQEISVRLECSLIREHMPAVRLSLGQEDQADPGVRNKFSEGPVLKSRHSHSEP